MFGSQQRHSGVAGEKTNANSDTWWGKKNETALNFDRQQKWVKNV